MGHDKLLIGLIWVAPLLGTNNSTAGLASSSRPGIGDKRPGNELAISLDSIVKLGKSSQGG